jgi:hypothetical protein
MSNFPPGETEGANGADGGRCVRAQSLIYMGA